MSIFSKKINDSYGHQVGDAVLIRLVALMREQVRSSDIVARYGGEEFAVIPVAYTQLTTPTICRESI